MLRSTSVVITTIGASPLIELSPVSRPTRSRAVRADEVAVLLVRQRLERRRVEGLAAARERALDRVLGDEGLARAGRRGDEHRTAGVERVERVALEVVEREASGAPRTSARTLTRPARVLDVRRVGGAGAVASGSTCRDVVVPSESAATMGRRRRRAARRRAGARTQSEHAGDDEHGDARASDRDDDLAPVAAWAGTARRASRRASSLHDLPDQDATPRRRGTSGSP